MSTTYHTIINAEVGWRNSILTNADVIVISHPNSGRTWLSNITEGFELHHIENFPKIEFTHDIQDDPMDDIFTWQMMVDAFSGPQAIIAEMLGFKPSSFQEYIIDG